MTEIKRYITIRECDFKGLGESINERIEQLYQPFESPYVVERNGELHICHAMVEYSAHPETVHSVAL